MKVNERFQKAAREKVGHRRSGDLDGQFNSQPDKINEPTYVFKQNFRSLLKPRNLVRPPTLSDFIYPVINHRGIDTNQSIPRHLLKSNE